MSLLTLHASAATTVTGTGLVVPVQAAGGSLAVFLDVTVDDITTADFDIQWSLDGANFWELASQDSMTQATGITTEAKIFTIKGPFCRVAYTLTGTSVTWSMVGHVIN